MRECCLSCSILCVWLGKYSVLFANIVYIFYECFLVFISFLFIYFFHCCVRFDAKHQTHTHAHPIQKQLWIEHESNVCCLSMRDTSNKVLCVVYCFSLSGRMFTLSLFHIHTHKHGHKCTSTCTWHDVN